MSSTGSSRGNPSMGDIVRSVAVLSALVLALWGFGQLFTKTPDTPIKPIDYVATVKSARPAAAVRAAGTVDPPEGLGRHVGEVHAGDLAPRRGDRRREVCRARAARRSTPRSSSTIYAKGSKAAGTATIAGETWNVRKGPDGDITFVRTESGLTTLVTGEAPRAEVEAYVSSLSAS